MYRSAFTLAKLSRRPFSLSALLGRRSVPLYNWLRDHTDNKVVALAVMIFYDLFHYRTHFSSTTGII